jgi:hypothetical protein
MIKKHDDEAVDGYDIDAYDSSVLSKRSLAEIAGDQGSKEWQSRPAGGRGKLKAAWLADAVAKLDQKKAAAAGAKKKPITQSAPISPKKRSLKKRSPGKTTQE